MTIFSVLFLVCEILIIGIGALIGYRRGAGRSAVRVAYLAIIGIATFFIAKKIAATIAPSAFELIYNLLPAEDIKHLLDKSPELDMLVENLIGALATPVIFALLFLVLQLLSLICFKLVSEKIVFAISKKEELTKTGKWIGAGVGLVSAVAVAAILLSPAYTVFHVIDNTPDEAVEAFADTFGMSEWEQELRLDTRALKANAPLSASIKPSFAVTKIHPISDLITNAATTYYVPEAHAKESAMHTLHILADIAGDVLYVHHYTIEQGGTSMDALSNSVAAVTPHLGESLLVKDAAASALSALGEILMEDGAFMGMTLPQNQNAIVDEITHSVLDTMAHTTLDSVEDNMKMLFGTVGDDLLPEAKRHHDGMEHKNKEGLLVAVDHMKSDNLSPVEMLKQALTLFEGNAEMTQLLNDKLKEYLADQIPDDLGIDKDVVGDIITDILGDSDIDLSEIDLSNLSKDNIMDIIKDNNITIDESTLESLQGLIGSGDIDIGDIDIGDIGGLLGEGEGDVNIEDILGSEDLGDVDLGDIDVEDIEGLEDVDISNIDIYNINPDDLTPEIIEALRNKYGSIVDMFIPR